MPSSASTSASAKSSTRITASAVRSRNGCGSSAKARSAMAARSSREGATASVGKLMWTRWRPAPRFASRRRAPPRLSWPRHDSDGAPMTQQDLIGYAAAGAICLAICVALWALAQRRAMDQRLQARLDAASGSAEAAQASAEAFDSTLLAIDDGRAHLASGEESLAACAAAFDLTSSDPQSVVNALMRSDPDHAARLRALFERGEACAFEARGPKGAVSVEGRAAGALAWLRLTAASAEEAALPSAARLAAFLDANADPAWIAGADGTVQWANKAWLDAVGASQALFAHCTVPWANKA